MACNKEVKIKAQSVSEYSLFLAIALIAILTMNVYIKRGLQGRYRDIADSPVKTVNSQVASAKTAGNVPNSYVVPAQYEPYYLDTNNTVSMPNRGIAQTVTQKTEMRQDLPPQPIIRRDLSSEPIVVTGKNIEGTDAAKD